MFSIQLLVILLYFALTVFIGVWSTRHTKSSDAFTGAGLSIFAIVCASTGEWLGGSATTGVSEYGFIYGLSGAWATIANGIGVLFLGLFFAKLFRSLETGTVPGIIEKFFGIRARIVSSVALIVVMIAVGIAQMIAAGKLGENLMGIDFTVSCVIFTVIFIVYTLGGGMNAVASTNKLHLFVMYFGVILAVIIVLGQVGGIAGFQAGLQEIETARAAAGQPVKYLNMFTIGKPKVASWLIASILGACTAQAGLQPVFAAKDAKQAKKACIITAFCVAPFGFFTALLGIMGRILSERGELISATGKLVTNGKDALPTLMMNMNPIAGGIVLSAILAAVLSTVSPIILAAGTMVTRDLYQRVIKPDASDKEVLFMGRVTTAISGVLCCIFGIMLVNATAVLDIVYASYSVRGALVIVVMLGIFWKKASETGACWSIICTTLAAVLWVLLKMINGTYPIAPWFNETYAAVLVAFFSMVIFSYVFPEKTPRARLR